MKIYTKKPVTLVIPCLLALVMMSSVGIAQDYNRNGLSEIYGMFQTMSEDTVHETITGLNGPFTMDSTNIYGIGIGFNVTDHWNVNTDLLFGSTDATLILPGIGSSTLDADLFLWDINVDYNIMAQRLTPLVTAGIGLYNVSDTGVSETDFSYNFGAGGRWDVTDNILIKAVYRITWTELDDSDGKFQFDGISLSAGFKF